MLVFDDFSSVLSMSLGILYTITDVQELGEWMKSTLDSHPLFEPLTADELVRQHPPFSTIPLSLSLTASFV